MTMTDKQNTNLNDVDELDDYSKGQMEKIAEALNELQLSYDTRLVAALMSGRAASLISMLINAEIMTKDEALAIWKEAGAIIETPPERETKIMHLSDGDVFDPSQTN